MMAHELEPNLGWGAYRFGMSREKAALQFGKPQNFHEVPHDGSISEFRGVGQPVLGFGAQGLMSIGIDRHVAGFLIDGLDVMHEDPKSVLAPLFSRDAEPVELVGLLYFPKLTVACEGFFDLSARRPLTKAEVLDDDFRTMNASAPGAYDALRSEMRPLRLTR